MPFGVLEWREKQFVAVDFVCGYDKLNSEDKQSPFGGGMRVIFRI